MILNPDSNPDKVSGYWQGQMELSSLDMVHVAPKLASRRLGVTGVRGAEKRRTEKLLKAGEWNDVETT